MTAIDEAAVLCRCNMGHMVAPIGTAAAPPLPASPPLTAGKVAGEDVGVLQRAGAAPHQLHGLDPFAVLHVLGLICRIRRFQMYICERAAGPSCAG